MQNLNATLGAGFKSGFTIAHQAMSKTAIARGVKMLVRKNEARQSHKVLHNYVWRFTGTY